MTFSIICPVFNEISSISSFLDYLEVINPIPNEVFIVDGNSTDGTRLIIEQKCKARKNFHLIDNPDGTVPYALNLAIPNCTGDIIVRLDAHTEYSQDYFYSILETFRFVDADIVGGPMRTKYFNSFQESVAYATSVKFGVGNSDFHFEKFSGYTSSVYLGAWKNEIFNKIGLFDTRFKRNQDDEFHYRANAYGLKVYQNAAIKLWYYPRSKISLLIKQYFQYGLYKPMVLFKIKSGIRLRHFIPSFFLFYLIGLFLLITFFPSNVFLFSLPFILYLLFNVFYSFNNKKRISVKGYNFIVFPLLHIAYGFGLILGIFKLKGFDRKK